MILVVSVFDYLYSTNRFILGNATTLLLFIMPHTH